RIGLAVAFRLALRVGLRVRLRVRPARRRALLGLLALRRPAGVLLGVVGDVPAGALELKGGRRHELVDLAAALGARLDLRIGELLNPLEAVAALLAFVFVERHVASRCYSRASPLSSPSIS